MLKIVIIGGGAAGFFAAIRCAELQPNAQVTILERGKSILGKVKISGGGRCNVTNSCWLPDELITHYPRGGKALLGPFHRFCTGDTFAWFSDRGVALKIEPDGRVFPVTDSSQTIVDCLLGAARKAKVRIITSCRVAQLAPPPTPEKSWKITAAEGQTFYANKVMIATGSNPRMWDMLQKLGHKIVPPVPSLFTFNTKDTRLRQLSGVSVPTVSLKVAGTSLVADGALLVTHWGLSGPAILRLSAWGARQLHEHQYRFKLQINWTGHHTFAEVQQHFRELASAHPKRKLINYPALGLPARLWQNLLTHLRFPDELRHGDTGKKHWNALAQELTDSTFDIHGKSTFKDEFVTAGGVHLDEINFKHFSSKLYPSLYMAGEVINVDAITGGFNFQAAWTGGYLAGEAMAQ